MTTKSLRVRSCPQRIDKGISFFFLPFDDAGPVGASSSICSGMAMSHVADPAAAMLDIIAQTALANIQINRPDPFTGVQKRGESSAWKQWFYPPRPSHCHDNNKRACGAMPVCLGASFWPVSSKTFSFIFDAFDYKPDLLRRAAI